MNHNRKMDEFVRLNGFYYGNLFLSYQKKNVYKLLIIVLVLTLISYYINFVWKRRRLIKIMNTYNGPPTLPVFGNSLHFLGSPKELFQKTNEFMKHYTNPIRVWIMHKPYLMIFTPEDFQIVANKTLDKDNIYKFFVDMLGDGIFTSEVNKWKRQRRIINPTLNPAILFNYFIPIFNKQNINLIKNLKKEIRIGKHFDLWFYVSQTSIRTLCETAMGYEDVESNIIIDFECALIKAAELVTSRCYKPWLMSSLIFKIYKYLFGYNKLFDALHDLPLKMLKVRKEKFKYMKKNKDIYIKESKINYSKTTKKLTNNTISTSDKTMFNFIDMLLNAHEIDKKLTDLEVADEVISIMFGGSETNAITNCFCLLMLGMRLDIQEKVYEEIYNIFGDSNRLPDFEDLKKLVFLEQCIKETLRRFTVVPIILRHAKYDIPISNGKLIPAGANIFLSIHRIHHDPTIYPNPEVWNPSNFDPDKIASRHSCSFIPFSIGPRGCIGQKYAMVAMKAFLSTFLRNYKVSTDFTMNDIDFRVDLVIRSLHGYHVKLDYRHGKSIF